MKCQGILYNSLESHFTHFEAPYADNIYWGVLRYESLELILKSDWCKLTIKDHHRLLSYYNNEQVNNLIEWYQFRQYTMRIFSYNC